MNILDNLEKSTSKWFFKIIKNSLIFEKEKFANTFRTILELANVSLTKVDQNPCSGSKDKTSK